MEGFKTQSDSIANIAVALTKFQSQMKGVKKTAENPYFKSKYAELSDVWDEIRGPLAENNLAVIQTFLGDSLVTTLAHKSGEWFSGYLKLSPNKANDPQAQGSATTYARRYALMAVVGLAPIDDDGNAGSGRPFGNAAPEGHENDTPKAPARPAEARNGQSAASPHIVPITSSFVVDEPKKTAKGKIFWKAIDASQRHYWIWEDAVVAALSVADGSAVTVDVEQGTYPKIVRVHATEAIPF